MKYIYLIQSLENGYYKIGVSKHPQQRISELQTGNSSILKLITTYQTEFSHQIERALQRKYSYLHKEGEWFDIGLQEEVGFIQDCKLIEENIIHLKKSGNLFI